MPKREDELVEVFKQNHQRLFEQVLKSPLPVGAQLLFAGQQAEREAYEEVFGEAFRQIYDSFIGQTFHVGSVEILEKNREALRETDGGNLIEEFKATFKSLLEQLEGRPLKEIMGISTQFQLVELDMAEKLLPKSETRYRVTNLFGAKGQEVTIPSNYIIAGVDGEAIICLERLARAIKEQDKDHA